MFDLLCFNSRNCENELEGNCASVREEKEIIATTDLMDGHTILSIQDARVSLTKDPFWRSRNGKSLLP